MMLNRKLQPEFKNIEHIEIPVPERILLDNGIETYLINAGTQDIVKIDIIFNAGSWFQDKLLIATSVNEMLIEGTKNLSSQQIAEKLDYFGAFIHSNPTKDFANITLYTLSKYLPETIEILEKVIKFPTFPQDELDTFLKKKKQQFQIELEKVTTVARREFNEQLFGSSHPYGRKAQLINHDHVTRNDLIQFHQKFYNCATCKIIISGKVDHKTIELVNKHQSVICCRPDSRGSG